MIDYTVVLQAGGRSTRMGTDKALAKFRGRPLLQYILEQTAGLGSDTIIITNRPRQYRQFGLPLFSDVYAGVGALGGLYSAIYHATQSHCLLLACDMPFVNRDLIKHLLALAPKYDAVIPRLGAGDYAEPFRAVYSKRCLEPIRAAIEAGERRVISFFADVNIRFVGREEIERFDPRQRSFFNVNTPEDLAQAEALAEEWDTDSHR